MVKERIDIESLIDHVSHPDRAEEIRIIAETGCRVNELQGFGIRRNIDRVVTHMLFPGDREVPVRPDVGEMLIRLQGRGAPHRSRLALAFDVARRAIGRDDINLHDLRNQRAADRFLEQRGHGVGVK